MGRVPQRGRPGVDHPIDLRISNFIVADRRVEGCSPHSTPTSRYPWLASYSDGLDRLRGVVERPSRGWDYRMVPGAVEPSQLLMPRHWTPLTTKPRRGGVSAFVCPEAPGVA